MLQFNSHENIVAACEELAENLVSFDFNSIDQQIILKSKLTNKTLIGWLKNPQIAKIINK